MSHRVNEHSDDHRLTFPKTPPYNNTGDFLHSKAMLHSVQFHNYQWDKPGHDPAFHYTAAQRIFQDVSEKLEQRREWSKKEQEKLSLQWTDLYNEELRLKDTFKNLSTFVRSNEEKRQRAEHIRNEDYKLRMKRTRDIEVLQKKIDLVVESKKEMDANIADLKIYTHYLNRVAGASEDFKNADDLLARYEALVSTRNLLGKRQDENLKELETARAKTAKMIEENKFKILGLNNVVANLNARYNTASRKALHWESIVLGIERCSHQKYQELTEVKQSCWNMYLLMCRRKNETPKFAEDDFENQLVYIKQTLQELDKVKLLAVRDVKNSKLLKVKKQVRNKKVTV